jgi:isochorismate synthase
MVRVDTLLETPITTHWQTLLTQGHQRAQRTGRPVVVSVTESTGPHDAIQLFERCQSLTTERLFWAQPGAGFTLLGLGVAYALETNDAGRFQQAALAWRTLMAEAMVESPSQAPGLGPLLMGGFAFDAQRPTSALWQYYPHGRLVLPRVVFTQRSGEAWVTHNLVLRPESDLEAEATEAISLTQAALTLDPRPARPNGPNGRSAGNGHSSTITTHELQSAAKWQADVANATRAIREGYLEKVVLARAVQLKSTAPFNAARALEHLSAHYTGCYIFAIARGDDCFLGATPEQLVRLRTGEVQTMGLAGSIKRGKTATEDARLGQTLLNSAKDREEHVVVVQAVVEALEPMCARLDYDHTPSLLKLGNIQHLYTPIHGRVANGYTILDFVERLHPTPAVGGRPREVALQLIREDEGIDRGWYAGAVGWLDARSEGEFAVALRSALLQRHTATLFAGCGIMADSDPAQEYTESALKLKPMLAALSAH